MTTTATLWMAVAIKYGINNDYINLADYSNGVVNDTLDPEDVKMVANIGAPVGFKVDLSADGDTLWITDQNVMRGYALTDNCPGCDRRVEREGQ